MQTSEQFTHVPFIGYDNIIRVKDTATGKHHPFIISLGATNTPFFVPKCKLGDEGNLDFGGTVSSYTDKDPDGRRGKMITRYELLGEGPNALEETSRFYTLVAIPPGLGGLLLDPKYTVANQPPAQSFDYSQWLPLVHACCTLSFYGGVVPYSSGSQPFQNNKFPTTPKLPPLGTENCAGPFLYFPPGFYPSIASILNTVFGVSAYTFTLDDDPQYGILMVQAEFDAGTGEEGSGCVMVDFSHSVQN